LPVHASFLFVYFGKRGYLTGMMFTNSSLLGFRMLLKLFSLEVHSRMSFSMLLKMIKEDHSQCPSTKVWILKVPFILNPN
jgi:hypothetical protein